MATGSETARRTRNQPFHVGPTGPISGEIHTLALSLKCSVPRGHGATDSDLMECGNRLIVLAKRVSDLEEGAVLDTSVRPETTA